MPDKRGLESGALYFSERVFIGREREREREKGIGTDEVFGGARVQNGAGKGLTIDDDEQARNNRGGLGCLALAE